MDLTHYIKRFNVRRPVPLRIRELSQKYAKRRRALVGGTLFALSAAFGFWAQNEAEISALANWQNRNPPPPMVWKHALESRGWVELKSETREFQRIYRSLPAVMEDDATIWFSKSPRCIAVFRSANSQTGAPLAIHCARSESISAAGSKKASAPAWEPAGRSWPGFELALSQVDRLPRLAPPKAAYSDPREIHF